ncbi:LPXTG cell wall anchor domain-containing protein, partial [Isoptericola sp. b408]|uniref:LPXTG cell wall anchor domain-containing protein n=1 Tax=Isoptericola sp. b408 TaxID=3064653 RepID=UPI002713027F
VVVETTDTLPAGTEVTYDPTGADTEGVLIDDNEPNVTVTVTNHLPDKPKPTPTPTPKPTPTPPTPPTVPTAPDLPTTGSDLTLLWVALAVLGLGTGSVLVSRRLRRSS